MQSSHADEQTAIIVPRLKTDTPKSYAALCDYAAMGPTRSIDKLLQIYTRSGIDNPPTKHRASLGLWSTQNDWQARAAAYDAELAAVAAAEHTKRYMSDLEAHRRRASEAGQGVYIVASRLLQRMNKEIDTLELSPASLGVLLRAFTIALDLEAHALNIDSILPSLEDKEER